MSSIAGRASLGLMSLCAAKEIDRDMIRAVAGAE